MIDKVTIPSILEYLNDHIFKDISDEIKETITSTKFTVPGTIDSNPSTNIYLFGFGEPITDSNTNLYQNVSGDVIAFVKDLEAAYPRYKKMKEFLNILTSNNFTSIVVIISRQAQQFFVTMKYVAPSGKNYELRYVEDYTPDNFVPDAFLYDLEKLPSRNQ